MLEFKVFCGYKILPGFLPSFFEYKHCADFPSPREVGWLLFVEKTLRPLGWRSMFAS